MSAAGETETAELQNQDVRAEDSADGHSVHSFPMGPAAGWRVRTRGRATPQMRGMVYKQHPPAQRRLLRVSSQIELLLQSRWHHLPSLHRSPGSVHVAACPNYALPEDDGVNHPIIFTEIAGSSAPLSELDAGDMCCLERVSIKNTFTSCWVSLV